MVEPLLPNMVDRADALIPVCSSLPALVFGSLRMLVVDAMGYGDSWFWIGGLMMDASGRNGATVGLIWRLVG